MFWNIFHAVYLSWIVRLKSDHFKIRFFFIFALVSFLLAKISLNISFIFISKTQVRISKMERPFFDLTLLDNR